MQNVYTACSFAEVEMITCDGRKGGIIQGTFGCPPCVMSATDFIKPGFITFPGHRPELVKQRPMHGVEFFLNGQQ